MSRVARFLNAYARQRAPGVVEEEAVVPTRHGDLPGTLLLPGRANTGQRWVVLHGVTVPGARHPVLRRFARALAAAGGTVLIPEIGIWSDLRVDPEIADGLIEDSARHLARRPPRGDGVGVIGFSFGATQALITASRPEARPFISRVVGFGGYCDLARSIRFMLVGEHEWKGRRHAVEPDPYGRWVLAANFLTDVPGCRAMEAVASAAHELAAEAGRRFVYAGDADLDPLKARLAERLADDERRIWGILAPRAGHLPPREAAVELGDALAAAALRRFPQLDPRPVLPRLHQRVVLAHGYDDRLIPYSESLRLLEHLPDRTRPQLTITRLFAHSRGAEGIRIRDYPREAVRFLRLLGRALGD